MNNKSVQTPTWLAELAAELADDHIPIVMADRVNPASRRGALVYRTVEIVCPFDCGNVDRRKRRPARHTHGWPLGEPNVGHCYAHCPTRPRIGLMRSYFIIVPAHLGGEDTE